MKKVLLVSMAAFCFMMSYAQKGTIVLSTTGAKQECTNSTMQSFDATFSFDAIQSTLISTEKGNFSQITIPNTYPTGADGTPELPAARQLIAVPQGATPRVVVRNYTENQYNLADYGIETLYPHQPSVKKDAKPEDIKFVYNASAYAQKGFDEREIATVQVLGTMRGVTIGALTVNPVVYDVSENTIIVRNNIELEIVFDNADVEATKSLYESTFSIYFQPVYKQLFNRDVYDDHPDLYQTPTYMLVIAPDAWASTLEPWLEWKLEKGFYMDVHYTSETGTSYNNIKNFVYDKYNTGVQNDQAPTFLVLVGDTPQIPNTTGNSSQKVTDLYYSSVDGDYFPEMFCSRMCVSTTAELTNLINKILNYEKLECDPSYLSDALLIAGADSYWNPIVGQPAINYAEAYHFTLDNGYTGVHKYLTSYNNCYSWMNTGISVANYTAHGGETGWSSPSFSVSDANNLTNANKYFLAIGNCCLAADFGYSGVCLAEAMIRGQNKGAYTYIGSCPSTYWYEDYYWGVGATNVMSQTPTPQNSSIGVYDGIDMTETYNTTNSIVFLGNLAVCYAHDGSYGTHSSPLYYWQAYHCLGDGSIMPYNFGVPATNISEHMDIVPIGVDFYEVTTLPGSVVAISKDGVLYGTAVADNEGLATVNLNPVITSGGQARIVITRPNTAPIIEDVECAALDGPYMIGNSFTINDANGDGMFDYAEVGTIGLAIKNVGSETAVNLMATISSEDEYVTFTNNTANYGNVAPGDVATISDAFTVSVSPVVPDNHRVNCTVTMSDGQDSWTYSLYFLTVAPSLSVYSNGIEGQLLPGQTLNLTVTFINNGNADVHNAYGVYSTDCEYVTVNTTTPVSFGEIPAGETSTGAFSITVSPNAPYGTVINSVVTITGDNNYSYDGEFFPFIDICNVAISAYPYNEGFEEGELAGCWNQEIVSGYAEWTVQSGGYQHHPYNAHSGSYNALVYGDTTTVKLVTPMFDISNITNPVLSFWHSQSVYGGHQDKLRVYYKNSTDGEWQLLATYQFSIANWKQREIELPNPSSNYFIAFEAELNGGYGVVLDDVAITGESGTLLGDADGNGVVNVIDVMTVVNYIINGSNQIFIFGNADVNGDGVINVMDVMGIVNIIMNK